MIHTDSSGKMWRISDGLEIEGEDGMAYTIAVEVSFNLLPPDWQKESILQFLKIAETSPLEAKAIMESVIDSGDILEAMRYWESICKFKFFNQMSMWEPLNDQSPFNEKIRKLYKHKEHYLLLEEERKKAIKADSYKIPLNKKFEAFQM
jgi:hypothetical protein